MRSILILGILFLAGCSTPYHPVPDARIERVEAAAEDVEDTAFRLIVRAKDDKMPPLDLSNLKDVRLKVHVVDGVQYVSFTYTDYVELIALLEKMRARIVIQDQTIDSLIQYHEQRVGRQKVD